MKIKISEIKIKKGRRPVDEDKVRELADSIKEVGLLNPITVTKENQLIAGAHRIAAYKLLGRKEIEATAIDVSGLKAKLAEIDENLIRNELHFTVHGDLVLERKQIYEELHPETKAGVSQAVGMNRKKGNNVSAESAPTFVADTAEKTGVSTRAIHVELQIAENLTDEVKEIIRKYDIPKTYALKLARIVDKEKQRAAAEEMAESLFDEAHGKRRTVENMNALRRISQYRKTGVKPKDWVDGADDQLNAEMEELDARVEARSNELAERQGREAEYKDDPFPAQFKAYLDSLDSDVHKAVVCNSVMRICKQTLAALQRAQTVTEKAAV